MTINNCCPLSKIIKGSDNKEMIYRTELVSLGVKRDTMPNSQPYLLSGNRLLVEIATGSASIVFNDRTNAHIPLVAGMLIKGNYDRFWIVNEAQIGATLLLIVSTNLEVSISIPPVATFTTVTYEPNGGTGDAFSEFAQLGYPYMLSSGSGFTNTGKTLNGWRNTQNAIGISQITSPVESYLKKVAYGNGIYVAVGAGMTIITSADGYEWEQQYATGLDSAITGIVFAKGIFVAVSNIFVITSPDGRNWTTHTTPLTTTSGAIDIAYGNGVYVATCSDGTVITSPDGITWTQYTTPATLRLEAIAYNNGLFIAVGNSYTVITSPDGITWTPQSCPLYMIVGIGYQNGLFIATGGMGGSIGAIATSPDGITWTMRANNLPSAINCVAYGNDTFVAAGNSGTVITSPDGITWTPQPDKLSAMVKYILYNDSSFLLVGGNDYTPTSNLIAIMTASIFYPLNEPFNSWPYAANLTLYADWI